MGVSVATGVGWDYWRDPVHVSPCRVDKHGIVNLVKCGIVVRDEEVTTCTVAALGDDDVDCAFDVGVVLMDWRGNVAVRDSG